MCHELLNNQTDMMLQNLKMKGDHVTNENALGSKKKLMYEDLLFTRSTPTKPRLNVHSGSLSSFYNTNAQ